MLHDRPKQALAQPRAQQDRDPMNATVQALDAMYGQPAVGVPARLERRTPSAWEPVADAVTDNDGCILDWAMKPLDQGEYRIVLDSGSYFASLGLNVAYSELAVVFSLVDEMDACQIQLSLAPHSYSAFYGARA
jgi:5-hydroxyisourate hydrolase